MDNLKNLNQTELNDLSEAELKVLKGNIDNRLDELQFQKNEKRRKKREYALIDVTPERYPNYNDMWRRIRSMVADGIDVTESVLDEVSEQCHDTKRVDRSLVYPCPECESISSLYPGDYGSGYAHKYKITCSRCNFVATTKGQSSDYDAWESFHRWLIGRGYLDSSTKFSWY